MIHFLISTAKKELIFLFQMAPTRSLYDHYFWRFLYFTFVCISVYRSHISIGDVSKFLEFYSICAHFADSPSNGKRDEGKSKLEDKKQTGPKPTHLSSVGSNQINVKNGGDNTASGSSVTPLGNGTEGGGTGAAAPDAPTQVCDGKKCVVM